MKKRILLIGRPFSRMEGAGGERYAWNLVTGLRREHVDLDYSGDIPIVSFLSRYVKPYGNIMGPPLYDYVFPVLFSLTRGWGRYSVVHALDLPPGLFWPILKKTAGFSVITCHHLGPAGIPRGSDFLSRLWSILYDKAAALAFRNSDKIVSDSSSTAREISSRHGYQTKTTIVHPGVEGKFKPLTPVETKFANGHIVLGYVGAVVEWKGVDRALEVIGGLKEVHSGGIALLVAGAGKGAERLLIRAKELGVDGHVQLLGHVPERILPALYNQFDILLVPSLYEGYGYPIIEAQACGTPVLISEKASIPPEVGKCAIRYSTTPDAVNRIMSLFGSRSLYESVRNEGIEFARGFTLDSMLRKMMEVYGFVLPIEGHMEASTRSQRSASL